MSNGNSKKTINLKPLEMALEIMQMLEDKGLIIRLLPGRHDSYVPYGQTLDETIYECDPKYGGHKLYNAPRCQDKFFEFLS